MGSTRLGVAMANQIVGQYKISIPPGKYWKLDIPVDDIDGFYLFEVHVEQTNQEAMDVGVKIMDEDNFRSWDYGLQAIAAGAKASKLPEYKTLTSVKLRWGTVSFKPRSTGRYQIIMDNTHPDVKAKNAVLNVYWMSNEFEARRSFREVAQRLNWTEIWRLYELSEEDLQKGRLSNSCDNVRKAYVLLWKSVCGVLSRKPVLFDAGKSPDIGILKERIAPYVPDYFMAQLAYAWSLPSELAHIEKREGKEPPLNEVMYAFRIVLSSAAFLVSLMPAS
jgi:hypothetical protein